MQVTKQQLSDTKISLTISAGESYLTPIKQQTLQRLSKSVKLPGFREGKVPLNLVEKNIDEQTLQTEFMNDALEQLYPAALQAENLRPVDRPNISLKKFVPFSEIEFEAELNILGPVKMADYKKFTVTVKPKTVTDKDINEVIDTLKTRLATKNPVKRVARAKDETVIDFIGHDESGAPIPGAEGHDYPLVLGSKNFIPGFEEEVVGLKTGQTKKFDITFPKDYHAAKLAGTKVTFEITVKTVNELVDPKIDDEFAQKIGPFKKLDELKDDIRKQLTDERKQKANNDAELEIVEQLGAKSTVSIPDTLVNDQVEHELKQLKQRLAGQGQTFQEFLTAEKATEEEFRDKTLKPEAARKLKISLLLAEVSEAEKITITPEELDTRMQMLKMQYPDESMQSELDKPEAKRDVASRILTEKTLNKLVDYATKKG